jgi:hypothetical protein
MTQLNKRSKSITPLALLFLILFFVIPSTSHAGTISYRYTGNNLVFTSTTLQSPPDLITISFDIDGSKLAKNKDIFSSCSSLGIGTGNNNYNSSNIYFGSIIFYDYDANLLPTSWLAVFVMNDHRVLVSANYPSTPPNSNLPYPPYATDEVFILSTYYPGQNPTGSQPISSIVSNLAWPGHWCTGMHCNLRHIQPFPFPNLKTVPDPN